MSTLPYTMISVNPVELIKHNQSQLAFREKERESEFCCTDAWQYIGLRPEMIILWQPIILNPYIHVYNIWWAIKRPTKVCHRGILLVCTAYWQLPPRIRPQWRFYLYNDALIKLVRRQLLHHLHYLLLCISYKWTEIILNIVYFKLSLNRLAATLQPRI